MDTFKSKLNKALSEAHRPTPTSPELDDDTPMGIASDAFEEYGGGTEQFWPMILWVRRRLMACMKKIPDVTITDNYTVKGHMSRRLLGNHDVFRHIYLAFHPKHKKYKTNSGKVNVIRVKANAIRDCAIELAEGATAFIPSNDTRILIRQQIGFDESGSRLLSAAIEICRQIVSTDPSVIERLQLARQHALCAETAADELDVITNRIGVRLYPPEPPRSVRAPGNAPAQTAP